MCPRASPQPPQPLPCLCSGGHAAHGFKDHHVLTPKSLSSSHVSPGLFLSGCQPHPSTHVDNRPLMPRDKAELLASSSPVCLFLNLPQDRKLHLAAFWLGQKQRSPLILLSPQSLIPSRLVVIPGSPTRPAAALQLSPGHRQLSPCSPRGS